MTHLLILCICFFPFTINKSHFFRNIFQENLRENKSNKYSIYTQNKRRKTPNLGKSFLEVKYLHLSDWHQFQVSNDRPSSIIKSSFRLIALIITINYFIILGKFVYFALFIVFVKKICIALFICKHSLYTFKYWRWLNSNLLLEICYLVPFLVVANVCLAKLNVA